MKALRYHDKLYLQEDAPLPQRADESLIRVTCAGICNTDIEIAHGYAGFRGTLGHEFVGIVIESEDNALVGKRVVGEINCGCGECRLCRSGDPRHCPARTVLGIVGRDGTFAEYVSLPTGNLLEVPDSIEDEQAVFTEPLAAACEILEQVKIAEGDRVAVIGDGKLGLLIAQVLQMTLCDLTLIGKHLEKLAIASRRGIRTARVGDGISGLSNFDFVVEASGSARGLDLALDLVRPRGTIVMKSTVHGATAFDAARVIVNEINLVGSRCGRFPVALGLIEKGAVDVESLISRSFPLYRGVEAVSHSQERGVLKVLLRP